MLCDEKLCERCVECVFSENVCMSGKNVGHVSGEILLGRHELVTEPVAPF